MGQRVGALAEAALDAADDVVDVLVGVVDEALDARRGVRVELEVHDSAP